MFLLFSSVDSDKFQGGAFRQAVAASLPTCQSKSSSQLTLTSPLNNL